MRHHNLLEKRFSSFLGNPLQFGVGARLAVICCAAGVKQRNLDGAALYLLRRI